MSNRLYSSRARHLAVVRVGPYRITVGPHRFEVLLHRNGAVRVDPLGRHAVAARVLQQAVAEELDVDRVHRQRLCGFAADRVEHGTRLERRSEALAHVQERPHLCPFLAKTFLGPLAFSDVYRDARHPPHRAALIANGELDGVEVVRRAVQFEGLLRLHHLARLDGPPVRLLDAPSGVGGEQFAVGMGERGRAVDARDSLPCGIDPHVPASR